MAAVAILRFGDGVTLLASPALRAAEWRLGGEIEVNPNYAFRIQSLRYGLQDCTERMPVSTSHPDSRPIPLLAIVLMALVVHGPLLFMQLPDVGHVRFLQLLRIRLVHLRRIGWPFQQHNKELQRRWLLLIGSCFGSGWRSSLGEGECSRR